MNPIPFNNLKPGYDAHKDEIDAAVARVLASGWYILGEESLAFEREFAAFCGVPDAVGVNSGTDALVLALRALGIGAGDEVITVAHTAVATVAAIALVGATPVLVDIDPLTYTLDPAALTEAITPHTRAVIPVHLYGQPADMDAILQIAARANIVVIEDCAQAHGSTYRQSPIGTLGDVACFSFYPTKNLGAMGDGGAVISKDSAVTEQVRLLREYGWTPQARYVSQIPGMNSRLDEVQAAILRVRLGYLAAENAARVRIAARYCELIAGEELQEEILLPRALPDRTHVWHLFVVRVRQRERVRELLAAEGIGTGIHYPVPVHLQPAYQRGGVRVPMPLTVTEQIAGEIVSLPMHPYLRDDEIVRVADALKRAVRTASHTA